MIPQPGVAPSPALASGLDGVPTSACSRTLPPHLIETTARPFLPHPRHLSRSLRSRTFAAGVQTGPEQCVRRQQRDVVAGGAIDIDEITRPKIRAA